MPRKIRIDAPGALHHIICRGIERKRIFYDNADSDDFVKRHSAYSYSDAPAAHRLCGKLQPPASQTRAPGVLRHITAKALEIAD